MNENSTTMSCVWRLFFSPSSRYAVLDLTSVPDVGAWGFDQTTPTTSQQCDWATRISQVLSVYGGAAGSGEALADNSNRESECK